MSRCVQTFDWYCMWFIMYFMRVCVRVHGCMRVYAYSDVYVVARQNQHVQVGDLALSENK